MIQNQFMSKVRIHAQHYANVDLVIKLERDYYEVQESDGEVEVCAVFNIIGCALEEFSVDLIKYFFVMEEFIEDRRMTLKFLTCQKRACASIQIFDDDITENEESFIVSLERTSDLDSRISLSPNTAVVTILDDDDVDDEIKSSGYLSRNMLAL